MDINKLALHRFFKYTYNEVNERDSTRIKMSTKKLIKLLNMLAVHEIFSSTSSSIVIQLRHDLIASVLKCLVKLPGQSTWPGYWSHQSWSRSYPYEKFISRFFFSHVLQFTLRKLHPRCVTINFILIVSVLAAREVRRAGVIRPHFFFLRHRIPGTNCWQTLEHVIKIHLYYRSVYRIIWLFFRTLTQADARLWKISTQMCRIRITFFRSTNAANNLSFMIMKIVIVTGQNHTAKYYV